MFGHNWSYVTCHNVSFYLSLTPPPPTQTHLLHMSINIHNITHNFLHIYIYIANEKTVSYTFLNKQFRDNVLLQLKHQPIDDGLCFVYICYWKEIPAVQVNTATNFEITYVRIPLKLTVLPLRSENRQETGVHTHLHININVDRGEKDRI